MDKNHPIATILTEVTDPALRDKLLARVAQESDAPEGKLIMLGELKKARQRCQSFRRAGRLPYPDREILRQAVKTLFVWINVCAAARSPCSPSISSDKAPTRSPQPRGWCRAADSACSLPSITSGEACASGLTNSSFVH